MRLTYDLTLAAARAMVLANPAPTFCYISGVGTDSTGKGRVMWRVLYAGDIKSTGYRVPSTE